MPPTATNSTARQLAEANRLQNAGDPVQAASMSRQVLKREPHNAQALYILGSCQLAMGDSPGAVQSLEKASRVNPRAIPILHNLSKALSQGGKLREAHTVIDRALALSPTDAFCLAAKADISITQGRFEEAERTLEPAIAAGSPHPTVILAFARIAKRVDRAQEAIDLLRVVVPDESIAPVNRIMLFFALGELLDKTGDYDGAFEAYAGGNRLYQFRFDREGHRAATDRMIQGWSAEAFASAPRSTINDERCVFVIGMPRSGTSLVEQILDSHPQVIGLGERGDVRGFVAQQTPPPPNRVVMLESPADLRRPALDKFARGYARAFRKHPGAARYTDKLPDNFLHLGLIALAFPGARVIHCTRDPLDTCLSCYFQHFGGYYPFAYDLEDLGSFYRDYERLMAHWKQIVDLPMTEIAYESLVADQEAETRRLLEFLGLEWDDACLRFHESKRVVITASNDQVRQPMYKSSLRRHERYASHIEPLRRAMGDR